MAAPQSDGVGLSEREALPVDRRARDFHQRERLQHILHHRRRPAEKDIAFRRIWSQAPDLPGVDAASLTRPRRIVAEDVDHLELWIGRLELTQLFAKDDRGPRAV